MRCIGEVVEEQKRKDKLGGWMIGGSEGKIGRSCGMLRRPSFVGPVDVYVTSECIDLYISCIIPRCLFWEVSVM